jgi:hypothetical protein
MSYFKAGKKDSGQSWAAKSLSTLGKNWANVFENLAFGKGYRPLVILKGQCHEIFEF